MITTRTGVINFLIQKFGYKKYLEVGVQYKENWNQISVENKTGVEPNNLHDVDIHCATSDEFFAQNSNTFDIIFIDGCHVHEQVRKDIENALKVIEKGGCIVFHDALPYCKEYTDEYRCGTVFKSLLEARSKYDYDFCTFEGDHGVLVIRKDIKAEKIECRDLTWEEFYPRCIELFNVKDSECFIKHFEEISLKIKLSATVAPHKI